MNVCNYECHCSDNNFAHLKINLVKINHAHFLRCKTIVIELLNKLKNSIDGPLFHSKIFGLKRATFYLKQCNKLTQNSRQFLIFEDKILCKHMRREFSFQLSWRHSEILQLMNSIQSDFNEIKSSYLDKFGNFCKNRKKCVFCATKDTMSYYKLLRNYICDL